MLGGDTGAQVLADVWRSPDGAHWELVQRHAPWGARVGLEVVVFRHMLWLAGGVNGTGGGLSGLWRTSNGTSWDLVSTPPWLPRTQFVLAVASLPHNVVNGTAVGHIGPGNQLEPHLVVTTGANFANPQCTGVQCRCFRDMWASQDGISWSNDREMEIPLPWPRRSMAACVCVSVCVLLPPTLAYGPISMCGCSATRD